MRLISHSEFYVSEVWKSTQEDLERIFLDRYPDGNFDQSQFDLEFNKKVRENMFSFLKDKSFTFIILSPRACFIIKCLKQVLTYTSLPQAACNRRCP